MGLDENTAFIVGHYPRSADGTVWLNVEEIEGHHILYSAMADKLAEIATLIEERGDPRCSATDQRRIDRRIDILAGRRINGQIPSGVDIAILKPC